MAKTATLSKTAKLEKALVKGQKLTIAQITAKFDLVNPRATIAYLKNTVGHNIVREKNKYQLVSST